MELREKKLATTFPVNKKSTPETGDNPQVFQSSPSLPLPITPGPTGPGNWTNPAIGPFVSVQNQPFNSAEDAALLDDETKVVETFRNLEVLAMLKENQKILTEGLDGIRVDERWAALQWILRFMQKEDREKNLQKVSRTLHDAFRMIDAALRRQESLYMEAETKVDLTSSTNTVSSYTNNVSRSIIVRVLRNQQRIERLRLAIQAACAGVKSLGETYKNDHRHKAWINVLLNETADKLAEIDHTSAILNVVPLSSSSSA
jgi:hypothetical protein